MVFRTVALLAGQLGGPGNIDGTGAAAHFNGPHGVVFDQMGNAFVADTGNHTIRRVVLATGAVSTIAGSPGVSGSADGSGAVARFKSPWGLAIDTNSGFSTIYIADSGNNTIRRLDVANNQVTTIAGTAGPGASMDGMGTTARFNSPRAVALDASTNKLYIADSLNNTVRVYNIGTTIVVTLYGMAGVAGGLVNDVGTAARFRLPNDLALDASGGNLFVSDANNSAIRKIALGTGMVTTLASGSPIAGPASLAFNGDVYVLSAGAILKIDASTGATSTFLTSLKDSAGHLRFDPNNTYLYLTNPHELDRIDLLAKTVTPIAGSTQHDDVARTGLLSGPNMIASDGADLLFVDHGIDYSIQQIVVSTGVATTYLAPTCLGSWTGIGNVHAGSLMASCTSANTIVKMSQTGTGLTTVAGSDMVAGSTDGTGTDALFNSPRGLVDDGAGNVYVADTNNHTIRKIVASTGVVTTVAGKAGVTGSDDLTGLSATFKSPTNVTFDGQGNLYVSDTGNHTVRQIVLSTGKVNTIA